MQKVSGIRDSTFGTIVGNLSQASSRAVFSGLTATGLSYYVMKRNDLVDILGIELNHAIADGIFCALGSATGDILSVGILPWTEKNLNLSDGVQNFVNLTAGPLVAGGTVAAAKYLLVSPSSKDTISHDILLAGGS